MHHLKPRSLILPGAARTQRSMRRASLGCIVALAAAAVLVVPGCVTTEKTQNLPFASVPKQTAANAPKQVKVGGNGVQLGEAQRPAVTAEAFTQRMHDLLAAKKENSARHWVERYPDVALDVLRRAPASQAANTTLQAIAKDYDELCCRVDAQSGWAALYKDQAEHPDHYAAQDATRKQVLEHLHNGRAKEAADIHLASTAKGAPGVALELDALQLTGEALLQADKPKEAVATLSQARKLAGTAFPHQTVKILLLLSDAERRAGREAPAAATWKEAAELAASLVNGAHAVADPGLWERLAFLRPVTTPWPAVVAQELNHRPENLANLTPAPPILQASMPPAGTGTAEMNEANVWALIGQWHLHRAEPQAALLAFKRAETIAPDQANRDRMELCAAKALAQMDQRPATLAILNRLVENQNSELAQPAFAVLGSLLFNQGRTAQAKALLAKAVGTGEDKDWPGWAEAEADLGLACLSEHEEAEGLKRLHDAQKRFEAEGDYDLLQQCLWNEAKYLERCMKLEDAAAVRQRSNKLESGGTALETR
jgi:tetratricopeptide (TPR) repeat protein